MGLPVDCGPRGRGTDVTGPGSHRVREACVCVCVCVGKAGEAVIRVVCGVSVGEDNWETWKAKGPGIMGGCGEQAPEARLCCSLPTSTRRGPFPSFPPAPLF